MSLYFEKKLPSPEEIRQQYPLTDELKAIKEKRDKGNCRCLYR